MQNNDQTEGLIQTKRFSLRNLLSKKEFGSIVAIIVMSVVLTITTESFLSVSNLVNVARQISTLSIVAVGMTFVVITSGIDLSVGSNVAFSGMMLAFFLSKGAHPLLAIIVCLVAGSVVGFLNGFLVAYLKLPPFVATLGTYSSFRGFAMLVTNGWPITLNSNENTAWFYFLGGGKLFNFLPMQIVFMIIVLIIGSIILKKTVYGQHVYAAGGNERAAVLAGISVKTVILKAYTIIGFLCGLAALLTVAYVRTAEPTMAQGMELDVIASAVIGGCSLSGGEGGIVGAFLGAVTIGMLLNGLVLLGASPFIQKILIGAVIIMAVILSERVRKTGKK